MNIAKKILSLGVSAVIVLIISGFLNLKPVNLGPALASHDSSCADISLTGGRLATDPAPSEDGTANSGTIDFNAPDHAYQACLQTAADATGNKIEGWAWNTNLGDISFLCEAGANRGGSCGAIDYSSVLLTDGENVRGFAWGDNIGWISMGCNSGDNTGVACGFIDYGVKVARDYIDAGVGSCAGVLAPGDLYGYAWTDSVGWMNFCGAHMDIFDIGIAAGISAAAEYIDSHSPVIANGSDFHEVRVRVAEDGAPISNGTPDREITVIMNGEYNVKIDQIAGSGSAVSAGAPAWDADNEYIFARVSSIAPTNDANTAKIIDLRAQIRDSAGTLIKEVALVNASNPKNLDFAPAAAVTNVAAADENGIFTEDAITTFSNVSQEVRLTADKNARLNIADGDIDIYSQLYDCSNEYDFVFDPTGAATSAADSTPPPDSGIFPNIAPSGGVCALAPEIAAKDIETLPFSSLQSQFIYTAPVAGAQLPSTEAVNALGYQTIISYSINGQTVRYFSYKVPDGSVLNQAAIVQGNVSTIVNKEGLPAVGRIAESIGQRAQSKREPYYRAKARVIGNKIIAAANTAQNITVKSADLTAPSNQIAPGVLYYKCDKNFAGMCSLIFDTGDGSDFSFSGEYTVVTEGYNIFIDSNIIAPAGRLGIIALEDLQSDRGGFAYICGKVTDVEANFVLDRSLMSYGRTADDCGGDKSARIAATGLPIFETSIREALKAQLTVVGSIVGENTYGGALKNPPLLGDGTRATPAEAATARYYDINFMRYAKSYIDAATGRACWSPDIRISKKYLSDTQESYGFPYSDIHALEICDPERSAGIRPSTTGIVNVIYSSPSGPVFNVVNR